MNNELPPDNDDFEEDDELEEEVPVYVLDDATQLLVETACNCLITLAEAQINEEAGEALRAIADALAERFAIDSIELEEHHHETDEGEETILAPKGGIFPESPEGPTA